MWQSAAIPEPIPGILIVDDSQSNLEILAGMLREKGFEPRPVISGKLALRAARADPPDLILLDVRMPEMDGFELCGHLKADEALKDIPIIFITALTATEDKVRAFSLGAVDFVTKPFQAAEIMSRVSAHLKIRVLQRALSTQNANLERLVAERTGELERAHVRVRELSRLKDDFLRMIGHEIRTPANGILGIGELILDLCPKSSERDLYAGLFQESGKRLRDLIDDATMIVNLEQGTVQDSSATSFSDLLERVRSAIPTKRILLAPPSGLESVRLKGDRALLEKALKTLLLLAASFSHDKQSILVTGIDEDGFLSLKIIVDALHLESGQAAGFFGMESLARSASSAEPLGLAPAVAYKILTALGGTTSLVRGEGNSGYIAISLPKETKHD